MVIFFSRIKNISNSVIHYFMEVAINESFYIRKLKDGYRLAIVKTSLTSIVLVISTRFEHTEVNLTLSGMERLSNKSTQLI